MKIDVKKLGACEEGKDYYNSKADFETAWNDCPRGDWMLWLAYELDVDKKLIIRAAVDCASTVRHLMSDPRSINALDMAIAYLDGEISREELNIVIDEAHDVTICTKDEARINAATAAAEAAEAAAGIKYAAARAADAAAGACGYDGDTAYQKNQRKTADICRKYFTPAILVRVKKFEKID